MINEEEKINYNKKFVLFYDEISIKIYKRFFIETKNSI